MARRKRNCLWVVDIRDNRALSDGAFLAIDEVGEGYSRLKGKGFYQAKQEAERRADKYGIPYVLYNHFNRVKKQGKTRGLCKRIFVANPLKGDPHDR